MLHIDNLTGTYIENKFDEFVKGIVNKIIKENKKQILIANNYL